MDEAIGDRLRVAHSVVLYPVKQLVRADKTLALIMIASAQAKALRTAAETAGGEMTFTGAYEGRALSRC